MENRMYVNDYLTSLHQQIAGSVDKIKYKSGRLAANQQAGEEPYSAYPQTSSALNGYAYRLLNTDVSYRLIGFNSEQPSVQDAAYAAGSYSQAAQVDRPSTVLIDFMFANNREFDFKV